VKQTITIEIAGTKFRLVADAESSHLHELAAVVNERVQKLAGAGAHSASSAQLLALAALGLADDLKASEARLQEVSGLTRAAINNAIARIDRGIAHAADEDAAAEEV
jgi:cell division protein ZapA (FtsZ GTPase activity inhibitor)